MPLAPPRPLAVLLPVHSVPASEMHWSLPPSCDRSPVVVFRANSATSLPVRAVTYRNLLSGGRAMSKAPFRPTALVPGPQFSAVAAESCRQRFPLRAPVVVFRLKVTSELPKVGPAGVVPEAT